MVVLRSAAHPGGFSAAPDPGRGLTLLVLCSGMFLVLLDVTAVNVALPSIGDSLNTDRAGLQGVLDAYVVTLASLLLGVGAVGDRFGHFRVVFAGVMVFGAASLACGLAPNIGALVGARAVQGIGAALLLPGGLALVTALFPNPAEQARALGVWAGASSLALPAGPVLGGWLVDAAGWRWVFLVNVPITALVAIAMIVLVREPIGVRHRRCLDTWGMVLAPLTLGAVVWAVVASGHRAGREGVVAGCAAVILGGLLVAVESRARAPMVPASIFRTHGLPAAMTAATLMNLATNGILLVTTLYLQQVRGYSALSAGMMLVPMALPLVLLAPVSGMLTARWGPGSVVAGGAALAMAGSLALLMVGPQSGYSRLLPALVGLGAGNGLMVAAVTAAGMRPLPREQAGLAGALSNTARQVGTAIGVAMFGAVLGSARTPELFAMRLHLLAWIAVVLWAATILCATRISRAVWHGGPHSRGDDGRNLTGTESITE